MTDLQKLSYPVGPFEPQHQPSAEMCKDWQNIIGDFPSQLRAAVAELNEEALSWRYRPGGWTIRQVVHHCADSHLNALARFKLALTEDRPTIKPYNEAAWAELSDYALPPDVSLALLDSLHLRWFTLLQGLTEEAYARQFFHPEHGSAFSVLLALDNYQWHCRHHLAHVEQAKELRFKD